MAPASAPGRPDLVLVAHGSRDPRSAATVAALAERVRRARPGLLVRPAFLERSLPSVEQVLEASAAPAALVPLLLGAAHHLRDDLPARVLAAAAARCGAVTVAGALGPDPRLDDAVVARAAALGDDPTGFVLAAPGSTYDDANDEVRRVAARATARLGRPVEAGFVATGPSTVAAAALRAGAAGGPTGLLPWFLAPGRLLDRALELAAAAGVGPAAPPLGHDGALVDLVLERYDVALSAPAVTSPAASRAVLT